MRTNELKFQDARELTCYFRREYRKRTLKRRFKHAVFLFGCAALYAWGVYGILLTVDRYVP